MGLVKLLPVFQFYLLANCFMIARWLFYLQPQVYFPGKKKRNRKKAISVSGKQIFPEI